MDAERSGGPGRSAAFWAYRNPRAPEADLLPGSDAQRVEEFSRALELAREYGIRARNLTRLQRCVLRVIYGLMVVLALAIVFVVFQSVHGIKA